MESFEEAKLCGGSSIDIFQQPDIDSTIASSGYSKILPAFSFLEGDHGNPLKFEIPLSDSHYLDLDSSFLYIQTKVVKSDGKNLDTADIVAPTSMFFYSMFKTAVVSVNGVRISNPTGYYPYEAGIPALLTNGKGEKESKMSSILFYKDTVADIFDVAKNVGFKKRVEIAASSKVFDMVGRIPVNIFQQGRFIPPGHGVKLEFAFNRPEFCLDSASTTNTYDYRVVRAEFYARMHVLRPSIESHHKKLFQKKTALFPFKDYSVSPIYMSAGTTLFETQLNGPGKLPTTFALGLVSNGAEDGRLNKDPWNFKHYNLKSITLSSPNDPRIFHQVNVDFKKNLYLLGYQTLMRTGNYGNDLSRDDFSEGNALFVFNLQDTFCDELHHSVNADLKLTFLFDEPLPEAVTAMLFASYERMMQLDGKGNVFVA